MATLLIVIEDSALIFDSSYTAWKSPSIFEGNRSTMSCFCSWKSKSCICGTFCNLQEKINNSGNGWDNIEKKIIFSKEVMSVSVSHRERAVIDLIYVRGTEPTAS